jgi:hypothetical protein
VDDDLLGWATQPLIQLDDLAPGLIRRIIMSAPMVRQAIFLCLAHRRHEQSGADVEQQHELLVLADLLRRGWAKDIVRESLGPVPEGLLSTLERIGPRPLKLANSYTRLWATFTAADPRKANALRALSEVTDRSIHVLHALDGVLAHAEVLKRVDSIVQARDLGASCRFLQAVCSAATDDAISAAFERMTAPNALEALLHRFLRRADRFPPPPVAGDDQLSPLTTARAHIEAGRRFRNCLGTMVGEVLVGRVAFAVFVGGSAPAICEFRPLSGGLGWLLAAVHLEQNALVPPDLRAAAQAKCASVGIVHVAAPDAGEWKSMRRLLRQVDPFAFGA